MGCCQSVPDQRYEASEELGKVQAKPRPGQSHKVHTGQQELRQAPEKHGPDSRATRVNFPSLANFPPVNETHNALQPYDYDSHARRADSALPKIGPHELESGVIYEGQWKGTKRHGQGRQIWPDGSYYEGSWDNDQANGHGRLIHADGDVYEGEWYNDKAMEKENIFIWMELSILANGETTSSTAEEEKNGQMVLCMKEITGKAANKGSEPSNGQMDQDISDGSRYQGEFRENNIDGHGVYEWADGRRFEGEWKDNKMEGRGIFTWPDGREYHGDYVDDKKEGNGTFRWPDGRSYEGQWKNGKQHGEGIERDGKGNTIQGRWVEGKRTK
eukprot:CAMPEP_0176466106 /NCGR_PEP_ID=MMETSP0127-20121128/37690_1 /TAXON_ID=938130 /ORGANISM="Platyophrya macrostoma, Strain WH" /LENGTH=328 /DNA_ID=CAMNT_0017859201 /DNA_START=25 /DNA_END=1012 /DNA_ORIENTATION=-